MTYLALFHDVILPIDHVSLALDSVTSFLRGTNIRNTYKRLRYSQTFGGILQCNGGKLEESEGYNCFFFSSFLVC